MRNLERLVPLLFQDGFPLSNCIPQVKLNFPAYVLGISQSRYFLNLNGRQKKCIMKVWINCKQFYLTLAK